MGDSGSRGMVLASLKQKMTTLRDELDKLHDDYDRKCKECDALLEEKKQVNTNIPFSIPPRRLAIISYDFEYRFFSLFFVSSAFALCIPYRILDY